MQHPLRTVASAFVSFLLPATLIPSGLFKYFDLIVRISLAEYNRYKNKQRLNSLSARDAREAAENAMVCVVGYREDPISYEKALSSYREAGIRCVVCGVDGGEKADMELPEVFKKVFPESAANVLCLTQSIGKQYIREAQRNGVIPRKSLSKPSEKDAFREAYEHTKSVMENAGFLRSREPPRGVCFYQPHCDLKEIRFSVWMFSMVLADTYGFEYLWSSDSDTQVLSNTIEILAKSLKAEPKAAGAGSYVRLHNAEASDVSRMAGIVWALDFYMNRAAIGALGMSECLNGPSSMYRISALREVMVEQYRFHYFQTTENTVSSTWTSITSIYTNSNKGNQRGHPDNDAISKTRLETPLC